MSQARFIVNYQEGTDAEETARRTMQESIRLVDQLNQALVPIVVGPLDNLPEGMLPGQPVIDWRSGTSELKVWNGKQLV